MHTNYRALLVLSSVFVCASLLSQSARAEYYLVYPPSAVTCGSPCVQYQCRAVNYSYESCTRGSTSNYMEFHSRRGIAYGEEERAPYAWIP